MDDFDNFASYLHNPFKYPNSIQIEARKYFEEMQNNIPDYQMSKALYALYNNPNHFGNVDSLYQYGLIHHYRTLKKYVIENNLIGLIIYGANIEQEETLTPNNSVICVYTTQNGTKITLSLQEISKNLLKTYMDYYGENDPTGESEIDKICKKALKNQMERNTNNLNSIKVSINKDDTLINTQL